MYQPRPGEPVRAMDWKGLTVRTIEKISTQGGSEFAIGTQFRVAGVYRGRLSLSKSLLGSPAVTGISTRRVVIDGPISDKTRRRPIRCTGCGKYLKPDILDKCQAQGRCYGCGAELPA